MCSGGRLAAEGAAWVVLLVVALRHDRSCLSPPQCTASFASRPRSLRKRETYVSFRVSSRAGSPPVPREGAGKEQHPFHMRYAK